MRTRRTAAAFAIAAGLCATACGPAWSAEFREVANAAAVLYDGPSDRARKLFIVSRGTPLEVVATVDRWIKVRDHMGDVLWIERGDLAESRHVVANTLAAVRRAPQENAQLVLQVERGVLLEVVDGEATPGWLRVRHRDGAAGFVDVREIWGR